MAKYSFLKGLQKGLVGAAVAGFAILGFVLMNAYPDIYNQSISDLVAQSLNQLIGGMTVGGLITFVVNFIKVNYSK